MRIKDGYILRTIVDMNIVVPVGEQVVDFKGIMTLTGIAPFIWSILEQDASREELYEKVLDAYEVTPEQARHDIDALLLEMSKLGLIES